MVRMPQGAWILTTDQVRDVDRRGAIWIYVQHEFERVCMKMTCVSLCNRVAINQLQVCHTHMGFYTNTVFTGCTEFEGGRNKHWQYSRQFCFSVSPPRQLVLVGRKKRLPFGQSQQIESTGEKKSPWSQYQFWNLQLKIKHKKRWRSSIWNISLQHNKKTRSCYCFSIPNHVPELKKKKKLIHLSLVTAACCSTWQMCGHIFSSICVFQVSFRVP